MGRGEEKKRTRYDGMTVEVTQNSGTTTAAIDTDNQRKLVQCPDIGESSAHAPEDENREAAKLHGYDCF
jgi:hypothetical protein